MPYLSVLVSFNEFLLTGLRQLLSFHANPSVSRYSTSVVKAFLGEATTERIEQNMSRPQSSCLCIDMSQRASQVAPKRSCISRYWSSGSRGADPCPKGPVDRAEGLLGPPSRALTDLPH